jgi:lambda family phage portal protein
MDNPMFSGGIEKGTFGEPIRYHILAADSQFQNNWVPVSVFHDAGLRNICHIYTETRAGQSRGVPFITPVMKSFAHIHKYQEAELKAAAIAAFFAIMIKHAEAGGSTPGMEGVDIMSTLGTPQQNGPSVDVKMAPGQAVTLPQGYDFETIKSDRPNSGYGAFIDSKFREVAMGLEIPYEILIKTFGASYSASRGAMLEFWKLVKVFRALFNQRFNQHVFERFMFEMVAKGQIPIPRYLTDPYTRRLINMSAVWIGPPRGMIDEEKEARAAEKRINTGLTTLKEEIISMTGGDLNSKYTQMKAERRMKKELEAIDNEFQTAGVA